MLVLPASAVDTLTLQLERLGGEDWEALAVELAIDWQADAQAQIDFSAAQISHPALPQPLKQVSLNCSQGLIDDHTILCRKGVAYLPHPDLDQPDIPLSFRWERDSQTLELVLERVRMAGGSLRVALHSGPSEWRLVAQGKGVDMAHVRALLKPYVPAAADFELMGKSQLQALIVGGVDGPSRMEWELNFTEGAFSDAEGEYLGEGLAGRWQGGLHLAQGHWKGQQGVTLERGAMLTPFFYLEPKNRALSVNAQVHYDLQDRHLDITQLAYRQPGLLQLDLVASISLGESPVLERLRLNAPPFEVQSFYVAYIQPTQAESLLANLKWHGQAALDIDYTAGGPQRVALELSDLSVDEVTPPPVEGAVLVPVRSLGINEANGRIVWTQGRAAEPSTLSWSGGHLLERITLGSSTLNFQLSGQQAELLQPADIPLLDGNLQLRRLTFLQREQGPQVEFDGALEPISMQAFSQAMGWPILAGTLAGSISGASYEQEVLTVGGSLVTNVFDGVVIIDNLRLADLFGIWPTLNADLKFQGLDLETLTSTFSFGKITGRLEGRVDGLYMENWRPVSFDARFATPENDDSRHRISQRAVDNISNLGGSGVSGAISRSFLRFFDEFGYDRLGISCRLKNGVCEMGGVAPAKEGYYLVKGGGIPRIDIVGFNRRIDWDLFVRKLEEISQSGTPVVD